VGSNQYGTRLTGDCSKPGLDLMTQAAGTDRDRYRRCGEVWGTHCQAWVQPPGYNHGNHPGAATRLQNHPDPQRLLELVDPSLLAVTQVRQLLRNPNTTIEHVIIMCSGTQCDTVLRELGKVWGVVSGLKHNPVNWGPHEWDLVLHRWPVDVAPPHITANIVWKAADDPDRLVAMWRSPRWTPATLLLLHPQVPPQVQTEALRRGLAGGTTAQSLLPSRISWNARRALMWAHCVHPEVAVAALDSNAIPLDGQALDVLIQRCSDQPRSAGALGAYLARMNDSSRVQQLWERAHGWHENPISDHWLNALKRMCSYPNAPLDAVTRCTIESIITSRTLRATFYHFYLPWERPNVTQDECPPQLLEAVYGDAAVYAALEPTDRHHIISLSWCPPGVVAREARIPVRTQLAWINESTDETQLTWYQALAHPNCPQTTLIEAMRSPNLRDWPMAHRLLLNHPRIPEEYRVLARLTQ
jgi:hypothetical protein